MGSVKAAKSNKLKTGQDDLQQEDVVQAVLIADSFSTRFAPITDTTPEVFFMFVVCVFASILLYVGLIHRLWFLLSTAQS